VGRWVGAADKVVRQGMEHIRKVQSAFLRNEEGGEGSCALCGVNRVV
jgi:hypothetical protein